MSSRPEPNGLLDAYLNINRHRMFICLALVCGVTVVVTLIYIAVFGFQSWKSNMKQAGSMMIINFPAPVGAPMPLGIQPQPLYTVPAQGAGALQYVCPNCGVVGVPRWSVGPTPLCPQCGSMVSVTGAAAQGNVGYMVGP